MLLAIPVAAHAHAEIFFPKLFAPSELQTSGFVLLNPDPLPASVYFYSITSSGTPQSSIAFTIPPGGQLAKLGSELFAGVATDGWVYVITDTEGMQAFWIGYNAELTAMDGAEADGYDTIGPDQVIPLVAGQTQLHVINPNFQTVSLQLRLFGPAGQLAATVARTLPAAGGLRAEVSDLFPSVDLSQARYLRIAGSAAIASSAVVRGYLVRDETVVINGINAAAKSEMVFPHVVSGQAGAANYTTVLGLTNVTPAAQNVTIQFVPAAAAAGAATTVNLSIGPAGSFRDPIERMFGLSGEFQTGWVKVTSSGAITGYAAYADVNAGGLAVVPAAAPESNLFFSHIANGLPQWQTGIALLNNAGATASVEVFAMQPTGTLIDSARFAVAPGEKLAKVLHELMPRSDGVNGGFVFVRSSVPLHGVELFYTRDLKVLSNVAAARLAPGVVYRPPAP